MPRLILALLLVSAVILAVTAAIRFLATTGRIAGASTPTALSKTPAPIKRTDPMPDVFRNVAYGLLIVLMFGVVTGWLGGV